MSQPPRVYRDFQAKQYNQKNPRPPSKYSPGTNVQDVQSLRDMQVPKTNKQVRPGSAHRPTSAKPPAPGVDRSAKNLEPIKEEPGTDSQPVETDVAQPAAQQPPPVERKLVREEDPEPVIEDVAKSSGQKSVKKSTDSKLQASGPAMSNQEDI